MKELIPTFIGVFGAISALKITFLILLYDASKRWITNSLQNLSFEIDNCLNQCEHRTKDRIIKASGDDLVKDLNQNIKSQIIDKDSVELFITKLSEIIKTLRAGFRKGSDNDAGPIAKDFDHLCVHLDDIERAYKSYKDAFNFRERYSKFIKQAIGVPLCIAVFFSFLQMFSCEIRSLITNQGFDYLIFVTAVGGFAYVYYFVINVFKKIRNIDK